MFSFVQFKIKKKTQIFSGPATYGYWKNRKNVYLKQKLHGCKARYIIVNVNGFSEVEKWI